MYAAYEVLKFWLPIISAFGLIIKAYIGAKKNVGDWANTLLSNHLTHIQDATMKTVEETQRTNDLISQHNEKEMAVWQGVVNTLAVLEDRTRSRSRTPRRKRK
jgi:hypothetical protein